MYGTEREVGQGEDCLSVSVPSKTGPIMLCAGDIPQEASRTYIYAPRCAALCCAAIAEHLKERRAKREELFITTKVRVVWPRSAANRMLPLCCALRCAS